jgi:hypothetical protein
MMSMPNSALLHRGDKPKCNTAQIADIKDAQLFTEKNIDLRLKIKSTNFRQFQLKFEKNFVVHVRN